MLPMQTEACDSRTTAPSFHRPSTAVNVGVANIDRPGLLDDVRSFCRMVQASASHMLTVCGNRSFSGASDRGSFWKSYPDRRHGYSGEIIDLIHKEQDSQEAK